MNTHKAFAIEANVILDEVLDMAGRDLAETTANLVKRRALGGSRASLEYADLLERNCRTLIERLADRFKELGVRSKKSQSLIASYAHSVVESYWRRTLEWGRAPIAYGGSRNAVLEEQREERQKRLERLLDYEFRTRRLQLKSELAERRPKLWGFVMAFVSAGFGWMFGLITVSSGSK